MSDTGGGPEQNASFGQRFMSNLFSGVSLKLTGLDEATSQLKGLTSAVGDLKDALQGISQSQHQLTTGLTSVMRTIQTQATQTATAVNSITGQPGSSSPGSAGSTATPQGAINAAAPTGQGPQPGGRLSGLNIGGKLIGGLQSNLMRDIALFPLRFMRDTLSTNRSLMMGTNAVLGGQSWVGAQGGMGQQQLFRALAGLPGNVLGSPEDLVPLYGMSPQVGAMLGWGGFGQGRRQLNAPRAQGFFSGIQQMQAISPGTPVPQLAQTLGGYGANTAAQQQSAYLTGGAFSLLGQGGGQRSLQQWAESILRWLEGLRMTGKAGTGFTYEELLSQRFPGSNIDAWFSVNGVPPDMREFWWNYALGKANKTASTTSRGFVIKGEQESLAYQRLRSTTPLTQSGFQLAGQMAGVYSNKEQANRWFNEMMGQVLNKIVPSVISRGPLSFMQFLPDTIEDMLMSLIERGGGIGTLMGGLVGWGPSLFGEGGLAQSAAGLGTDMLDMIPGTGPPGDVGDVGDYGLMGGTGVAGLHPDMRRKVGRMMRANPRLQMTSGLRDRSTQQRLRAKGYSRVSGGPSAHTRGLAADLGPPSEYNWLVANSKKFGLKSGVSHGEPWHVGMGDIGDTTSLFDLFKMGGISQGEQIDLIGGLIPGIMNMLLGAFAGFAERGPDRSRLEFMPDAYKQLTKAQATYNIGGKFDLFKYFGVPQILNKIGGLPGWMFPGSTASAAGGGGGGGATGEGINLAVNAAYGAGFRRGALVNLVAIAGRESGFDPLAHRTSIQGAENDWNEGDRGMWQINEDHTQNLISAGIIKNSNDLKNALTNAKAAYFLSSGGSNLFPWNMTEHGWDASGDPLYGTDVPAAKAAVQAAGYAIGDLLEPGYSGSRRVRGGGTTMVFNNTFTINGGNGNGIDARRAATQMADHLEEEMKRRSARLN